MPYGGSGFRPRNPPVNEGDEFDVTIEAVGAKGDGIARHEGFILFVPNTKEGEQVHIRVTKVLRKVGFAEVVVPGAPETPADAETTTEEAVPEAAPEAVEQPESEVELPPLPIGEEGFPEPPSEAPSKMPEQEEIPPTPEEPEEKMEVELPPLPEAPSEESELTEGLEQLEAELPPPPSEEEEKKKEKKEED